ncbi:MAG: DUF1476 domain-containing protein [Alphaproteobacteria bacterium]|nr:DUF1476 domain-containing protein [Alphaproteobacteria bacterium]
MSGLFDDKKKAAENVFALDEEKRFKVQTHAARLFGHWVAAQFGLRDADADHYAESVVDADFEEPGIQDVIRKVMADFTARGIAVTAHHLENQFNLHLQEALKATE